jgi:pimeloyl-ACP methyl ester carboxylesterase
MARAVASRSVSPPLDIQGRTVTDSTAKTVRKHWTFRRWIRVGFGLWALFVVSWLANSVRTRGVDENTLRSNEEVSILNDATGLTFLPASSNGPAALVFICGSGIAAEAYAPLLRPLAEEGFPVFVVKLPYRFAPLESHKQAAVGRAHGVIAAHPEVKQWVIAGHSLGGALAARIARVDSGSLSGMVLVATTHPKDDDLSFLRIPVTKIYASNDGVAPPDRVLANRGLLPSHTKWVEIAGGNHSQFGRYGHQLFDGTATISREAQEALTRAAILQVLAGIGGSK